MREAATFNAEGIHYLALDSFTPRGLKSICATPNHLRTVSDDDRAGDVASALAWLSGQPGVDVQRLGLIGRSHGAQAVLASLNAAHERWKRQPVRPSAAIALYPGCAAYNKLWSYEVQTPLHLMIGELDDWTPAAACATLAARIRRQSVRPRFEFTVYPESHHAFDGVGPVALNTSAANSAKGAAMAGGNPVTREAARRGMFEFFAQEWRMSPRMAHAQRFHSHHTPPPAASGWADIGDFSRVPLSARGQERYQHFLTQPRPRAFAIGSKGNWAMAINDPVAMRTALSYCQVNGSRCALYAVDENVVWQPLEGTAAPLRPTSPKAPSTD